jgi:hypothetical protein
MEPDWSKCFEECYPNPPATPAERSKLIESIFLPISPIEAQIIIDGIPTSDPCQWKLPSRPIPKSILSLLAWSNGGEFRTGERWIQLFPALNPWHGIRAMMLAYHIPHWMYGALPFAMNGGGIFYLFDMRQDALNGEYPIVCAQAGNLGFAADECVRVAESLYELCNGTQNVEELI